MCTIKPPFDKLRVYASLTDYLVKNGERIIRFWIFKRKFTPLEMEKKYIDQGCFEETSARCGIIREVIVLPDNDVLLGICELAEDVSELSSPISYLEYYKLSELRIGYFPKDEIEYGLVEAEPEVDE